MDGLTANKEVGAMDSADTAVPILNLHAVEAEFVALRGEILKRIEMRQQIVAVTLTLAGVFLGVGVAGLKAPGRGLIVLIYPPLAAFLAFGWAQNDFRIRDLAKYLRTISEPALSGPRYEGYVEQARRDNRRAKKPNLASWRFVVLSHGGVFLFTQFMAVGIGVANFSSSVVGWTLLVVDVLAAWIVVWLMHQAASYGQSGYR